MATPILRPVGPGNLLSHPRFASRLDDARPPMLRRRRGRLPRGVVSIKSAQRLRPGALAEVFKRARREDNGKRMRITDFDPGNDGYHWECTSLDGPIQCEGGKFESRIWFKPGELRRVWSGLSENERIKLQLLRDAR